MSTKFIRPRGTEDIYYEYSQKFQTLTTTFYKLAHMYGYSFIETPTIEHKELFIRSVGSSDIVHKEFYDFVEAEPDTEHGPGDGLKYYKYIGKKTNDKIQTRADAFLMRTRFKAGDLKDKLAQLKTFVPAAITIYLDIEKEVNKLEY